MAWALLDSDAVTFADGSAGHSIAYPGGQPAAGDLLLLAVSSDTTVSTPDGWTAAVSDVVNQGDYLFYRLAGTGEAATVTVTTNGDFNSAASYLRYSGAASASPLDVTATGRENNVDSSSSPAVAPGALAGTGELAIVAACNQQPSTTAPTGPSVTSGYSIVTDTGLIGTGVHGIQHYVAADTAASGTQAPVVSWTTSTFLNRTSLFAVFLPASTVDATVTVPAAMAATVAAPAPAVAGNADVVVPTAMAAAVTALAPTIPTLTPTPGVVAATAAPLAGLTASASDVGPHRYTP